MRVYTTSIEEMKEEVKQIVKNNRGDPITSSTDEVADHFVRFSLLDVAIKELLQETSNELMNRDINEIFDEHTGIKLFEADDFLGEDIFVATYRTADLLEEVAQLGDSV